VLVTGNSTYTIDCSGKGGVASAAITLEIGGAQGTGLSQSSEMPTQSIILVNSMTEAERQTKIVELRLKIQELIKKLAELIAAMQKGN
jgi:hypothetical protein